MIDEMHKKLQESADEKQEIMKENETLKKKMEQYDKVRSNDRKISEDYKNLLEELETKEELDDELTERDSESGKLIYDIFMEKIKETKKERTF
mmetsp:Transcript_5832/g.6685  ORF Transcript_5832/g.6685 Transcript_5832/m.6685 type:complete len:93 (+) Transcript_5832:1-279(+)